MTTSEDFGPSVDSHGYIYALDLESNWKWGNYFIESETGAPITQIVGCQMSSNGDSLAVVGMSGSDPVVMDINTLFGTVNKYLTFTNNSNLA